MKKILCILVLLILFIPNIKAEDITPNAKSAILDGEIVVYDKVNKKYAPFGDNKTIAKEVIETDKCLVYQIFDIITSFLF